MRISVALFRDAVAPRIATLTDATDTTVTTGTWKIQIKKILNYNSTYRLQTTGLKATSRMQGSWNNSVVKNMQDE